MTGNQKYGEAPERFWRLNEIAAGLRDDHPDWSDARIRKTAAKVAAFLYRNTMDWRNKQEVFHSHTILYGLDINSLQNPDEFDDF